MPGCTVITYHYEYFVFLIFKNVFILSRLVYFRTFYVETHKIFVLCYMCLEKGDFIIYEF